MSSSTSTAIISDQHNVMELFGGLMKQQQIIIEQLQKRDEKREKRDDMIYRYILQKTNGKRPVSNLDENDDNDNNSGSESDDERQDPTFGTKASKRKQRFKKTKSNGSTSTFSNDEETFLHDIQEKVKNIDDFSKMWFRRNAKSQITNLPGKTNSFTKFCIAIFNKYDNAIVTSEGIDLYADKKNILLFEPRCNTEEVVSCEAI